MQSPQSALALIAQRESGLQRLLSPGRISMIALGGTIGSGLFLGLGLAIQLAGPAALLSYLLGAGIALLLMGCLAEMVSAHPTPGSFAAYADLYIGPFAGFLVRYVYWTANVLAIGAEVAAVAVYIQHWFASSPAWLCSAALSGGLIYLNTRRVSLFGTIEYWMSMVKILVVVLFIVMGSTFVLRSPASMTAGLHNFTAYGGFLPQGLWGAWCALVIALFSYFGVEMAAVAAGEAKEPQTSLRGALRSTVVRLILFYILTLIVIVAIVPWTAASAAESPFVLAMHEMRLPSATLTLNLVLLLAALSAINSQLYSATRMMFSLSRANLAPAMFGSVSSNGVPLNALYASSFGVLVAIVLTVTAPQSAYPVMIAISTFCGAFTWILIFFTHYAFRSGSSLGPAEPTGFRMPGFPVLTLSGLGFTVAILVTTVFMEPFHLTLVFGAAFVVALGCLYFFKYQRR